MASLKQILGPITLPPTPTPATALPAYQQAVSTWTRKAEQTIRQIERALTGLTAAQIPQTVVIGTTLPASLSLATTAPLTGGGSLASGLTLGIPRATSSVDGYLSSLDWTSFNAKADSSLGISQNIDGGSADAAYLLTQNLEGGAADAAYLYTQSISGGSA